ncbi:MAG: hypothetical protein EHM58_16540 [Ignavibacteriae bacterium]|nr:MAG: hypothetical protein EHM58_16540 [Ignavibacteriota bacterium]
MKKEELKALLQAFFDEKIRDTFAKDFFDNTAKGKQRRVILRLSFDETNVEQISKNNILFGTTYDKGSADIIISKNNF